MHDQKPRSVAPANIAIGVGLVLLIVGGAGFWRGRQVALDSRQRLSDIQRALSGGGPSPQDGGTGGRGPAPEAVQLACDQASELDRQLSPAPELSGAAEAAAPLVGRLPQVGDQAAGMVSLVTAASDAFAALRLACDGLEPLLQARANGADISTLLAVLGDSRGQLRAATARLRSAETRLAGLNESALDDTSRGFYRSLRDRLPPIANRLALLAELPALLGHDAPQTFLVLGQNSDELRPTGGFIGTAGVMTFADGRLSRREYGSSASLLVPPDLLVSPPTPLHDYMDAAYWQLREANWAPDFPSTALQARYFYDLVRREQLSGVVAMDQELAVSLLGMSGPVEVPEYHEVVSEENVGERLEYHVHGVWDPDEYVRKGFVAALFSALSDRLGALPAERLNDLATVLERGLEQRHLLVWATDPRAQQAISDLGWDGSMLATNGDYLFPVSANLGANKINREVEQELDYDVTADPNGRLVGRATLRLKNRRPTSDPGPYPTADYRDYVRLYVPSQSELVSGVGFDSAPSAGSECGRTVFSGFVVVRPGEERELRLTYRLPPALATSPYSLLVQKQAGTAPFPLRIHGGAGDDAIESRPNTDQAFVASGGQLRASGLDTVVQRAAPGPACEVVTSPPQVLRSPSAIVIPKLGVQAEVIALGVEADGTLESPGSGSVVGWYQQTARPGQVGNMIASGHVDWDKQLAVFWQLRELVAGDELEVLAEGGARYRYVVEWVRQVDPQTAPIGQILGSTSQRWLTLITCGGEFDQRTRSYRERTIVRAGLATTS